MRGAHADCTRLFSCIRRDVCNELNKICFEPKTCGCTLFWVLSRDATGISSKFLPFSEEGRPGGKLRDCIIFRAGIHCTIRVAPMSACIPLRRRERNLVEGEPWMLTYIRQLWRHTFPYVYICVCKATHMHIHIRMRLQMHTPRTFTNTHIYVYTYMHIHVRTHVHMHVHMHTHTYIYTCTYMSISMNLHKNTHMLINAQTHTCTYICIHMFTHTHTHTYIEICVCVRAGI